MNNSKSFSNQNESKNEQTNQKNSNLKYTAYEVGIYGERAEQLLQKNNKELYDYLVQFDELYFFLIKVHEKAYKYNNEIQQNIVMPHTGDFEKDEKLVKKAGENIMKMIDKDVILPMVNQSLLAYVLSDRDSYFEMIAFDDIKLDRKKDKITYTGKLSSIEEQQKLCYKHNFTTKYLTNLKTTFPDLSDKIDEILHRIANTAIKSRFDAEYMFMLQGMDIILFELNNILGIFGEIVTEKLD